MSKRQISPKQLNRVFCSPSFLRRLEATGKPGPDVFMAASDAEVDKWLAEGARVERDIRYQTNGTHILRGFRGVVAGLVVAFMAMLVATAFSPVFRDAVGQDTQWQIGSQSLGWPAPFFVFFVVLGIPSMVTGPVVARLSGSRLSMWSGLVGLALGCWWQIHTS